MGKQSQILHQVSSLLPQVYSVLNPWDELVSDWCSNSLTLIKGFLLGVHSVGYMPHHNYNEALELLEQLEDE
jgi:hypothetical protein